MIFEKRDDRLYFFDQGELICIESWGENSLRVRATMKSSLSDELWALLPAEKCPVSIEIGENSASITNGRITARFNEFGWLSFHNQRGETLLEERWRVSKGGSKTSALHIPGRQYKAILGSSDYKLTMRFEARDEERIYGLGQRQEKELNMKGSVLELAQRNSQASIPFALSNLGYGFLWNNPAIGEAAFANNGTVWKAECAEQFDYWICAGDTPSQIVEAYANATGKVPMMPDYGTGFWQCKLRYKTQDELMRVAREYKRRGLPISLIVIDFFHWPKQGDWKLDPEFWPDPQAMVDELKELGIELMVSIWPTVDVNSENYDEMREKGYLVRSERGNCVQMQFMGNEFFLDATNPDARRFAWSKAKENYYRYGIKTFWLDEAEPEFYMHYDFDSFRYYRGPVLKTGNIYPLDYAQAYYDGLKEEGHEQIVNLLRCAWAGSQRYGALLWSGDVHSTFECFRRQLSAGLNAGLSGIPWWTTDIGGFTGGNIHDPNFHELLVRWFQFGLFCPVTRLHGFREPADFEILESFRAFYATLGSGAENEIWSYGEEVYNILQAILHTRERIRPYVTEQMRAAHEKGTPIMRPLFYDYPQDENCWEVEDEYMFGPNILVAPIMELGQRSRDVYLPSGAEWTEVASGKVYEGGQWLCCDAPLDLIPVFTTGDYSFSFCR